MIKGFNTVSRCFPDGFLASHTVLEKRQISDLTEMIRTPQIENTTILTGRAGTLRKKISGIGPVIMKQYRRGGIIEPILKNRHLNLGPCRAHSEYKMLLYAKSKGIQVPTPVAFMKRGRLFYQCWLATQEIENKGSLAKVCPDSPKTAGILIENVSRQIRLLMDYNIHHVDLHPGNVLAQPDNSVCLIDFDKAVITRLSKAMLTKKYRGRWDRAIRKYQLDIGQLKI